MSSKNLVRPLQNAGKNLKNAFKPSVFVHGFSASKIILGSGGQKINNKNNNYNYKATPLHGNKAFKDMPGKLKGYKIKKCENVICLKTSISGDPRSTHAHL